jgi:beta-galactosidase
LLDKTGAIKPLGLERQSWWSPKPVVSIARRTASAQLAPTDPGFVPLNRLQVQFADWSPANREAHDENVEVFSNCDSVELFLNDKSLGAQPLNADASPRTWKVVFAPGALRAVAKNKDAVVATTELRTAGAPARIVLSTNRKKLARSFEEVAEITALVVDVNGVTVPSGDSLVSFAASGAGAVVATDSADNASHAAFQSAERAAFRGRCVAFVKATAPSGAITITATAPGLAKGTVLLEAGNVR